MCFYSAVCLAEFSIIFHPLCVSFPDLPFRPARPLIRPHLGRPGQAQVSAEVADAVGALGSAGQGTGEKRLQIAISQCHTASAYLGAIAASCLSTHGTRLGGFRSPLG